MIPTFPEFQSLELTDRSAVEAAIQSFPPYSDFSFTNLYAWNAQVSSLHGNLVVRYIDCIRETPFVTLVGHHRLAEAALRLLELAKTQCFPAILHRVPESTARALAEAGFTVEADEAAQDYVYAVDPHSQHARMDRAKRAPTHSPIRSTTFELHGAARSAACNRC